jgi:hypothetical protein
MPVLPVNIDVPRENATKSPVFCGFLFTTQAHFRMIELTKEELRTFCMLRVLAGSTACLRGADFYCNSFQEALVG